MKNYMDALQRRKENGESGFSLIELIVVVVILGILAAIAVPVFMGLQANAAQSAQDSIAGNAASEVAADLARDVAPDVSNFEEGDVEVVVAPVPASATLALDNFCVTASGGGATPSTSGPGCP